jgi:hypothetical protein
VFEVEAMAGVEFELEIFLGGDAASDLDDIALEIEAFLRLTPSSGR